MDKPSRYFIWEEMEGDPREIHAASIWMQKLLESLMLPTLERITPLGNLTIDTEINPHSGFFPWGGDALTSNYQDSLM